MANYQTQNINWQLLTIKLRIIANCWLKLRGRGVQYRASVSLQIYWIGCNPPVIKVTRRWNTLQLLEIRTQTMPIWGRCKICWENSCKARTTISRGDISTSISSGERMPLHKFIFKFANFPKWRFYVFWSSFHVFLVRLLSMSSGSCTATSCRVSSLY